MDLSMESTTKPEDSRNPSPRDSISVSSILNNGSPQHQIITRSDHSPTTFVQADTSTFKQVVQILTGSSETAKQASSPRSHDHPASTTSSTSAGGGGGKGSFVIPPIKTTAPKKQSSFKLYERRHSSTLKNNLMINTLMINRNSPTCSSPLFSPRNPELLSPSCLDFPKLALNSPVTPLNRNEDPFNKLSPLSSLGNSSEEDRAIAEKGFYLHPSPISTPRDSEPQLLPLFPLTSPRVSSGSFNF